MLLLSLSHPPSPHTTTRFFHSSFLHFKFLLKLQLFQDLSGHHLTQAPVIV